MRMELKWTLSLICAKILDDIDSRLQNEQNPNQDRIQDNLESRRNLSNMGKSLLTDFDKMKDLCHENMV